MCVGECKIFLGNYLKSNKRFRKQKTVLQTFHNGGRHVRSHLRMSHYRSLQMSREWWDPTSWRPVRVCIWRPGQVWSTVIIHPWKTIFKGSISISRGHSLFKISYFTLIILLSNCFKLTVQLLERRFLSLLSLRATEVTQHITTGIIPLRQQWTLTANTPRSTSCNNNKQPTKGSNFYAKAFNRFRKLRQPVT